MMMAPHQQHHQQQQQQQQQPGIPTRSTATPMFLANGTAYTPLVTNCAPLSTSSGNVNQSIHHHQQQQQQQHTNSQDFREIPQQALADSVSAITTHPDFTAALAAAITSIISQNNTQSAHIHAAAQQLQHQAREGGVAKETTTTSQSSAFTVVTPVNGGAIQRERVERQSPPRVGGAPAPVPVAETSISSILNSALMSITNDQKPGIKPSSAASHLVATTTERAQR